MKRSKLNKMLKKQEKLLVQKLAKRALKNFVDSDWGNNNIYDSYDKIKTNRFDKE